MRSQVQVGICVRPLVDAEIEHGAKSVVEIVGKRLLFNNSTSPTGYDFEHMFGPSSVQTRTVYDTMICPLVDKFFLGFTATVFAYGQTGSGKTYLMGSSLPVTPNSYPSEKSSTSDYSDRERGENPYAPLELSSSSTAANVASIRNFGIIPFSLDDIFKKKSQLQSEGATVQLEMSYLEIYQEDCYDLLAFLLAGPNYSNKENKESTRRPNSREKDILGKTPRPSSLEMRENARGETLLEGLSSWPVSDQSEVNKLLDAAAKARATGKTAMNARSSRSHAIATLSLRITTNINKTTSLSSSTPGRSTSTSTTITSRFHLVDLAGSERVGKTLATGECLREGVSINRGLLTLGKVVSALNEQQLQSCNGVHATTHIPYRESKLTRLLKDALGGNGMTVMLACCSPADTQFKETLDTLRFAGRASSIVNNAKQNMDEVSTDLPPFVCYNCGCINPQGLLGESIDTNDVNDVSACTTGINLNIGSKNDDNDGSESPSSPKGVKRGRDGVFLEAIDTMEEFQISDKKPSNTFLLLALESRGKEVTQLKKKIVALESDQINARNNYQNLELMYQNLQTEMQENKEKHKKKKKKNIILRAVHAVGKKFTNKEKAGKKSI